jgi:DNA mismatch endonuclease, patch repair protein
VDRVTKRVRSQIMASVGSRGNRTTEKRMAAILWKAGLRGYRKHWRVLGKPDFAWPGRKIALFVDGCFWHGCKRCNRPSKSNVAFWRHKVLQNQMRDKRISRRLRSEGWKVLRVWECRVTSDLTLKRIRETLAAAKLRD